MRLPIRERRDCARWAIEIVQNDVTEAARRQGGKQRREPFDRHYCNVRSLIAGESAFNAMSTNWRIPKGRVLKQRTRAAHENCCNEVLSERD